MKRFFLLFLILSITKLSFASLSLSYLGTWQSGIFNGAVAEISAYDPVTHKVFCTNVAQNRLNMFDISNPSAPVDLGFIDLTPYGGSPNSVTVKNGVVATAVQAVNPQNPGAVVFFTTGGVFLNSVAVGAVPDMLTFSPDGQKVLVCNEAEPNAAYTSDPDGSVSIIDISGGVASATVTTATFTYLNGTENALRASGIRIYGNNGAATAAQDFEPEYLTISGDGQTAWVTLQENNAIAILNIPTATFTSVVALGYKNWNTGPQLDACDRELPGNLPQIHFANWPVYGMYQPDAIASYQVGGQTYLVTANEGDAREYSGVNNEQIRVNDIPTGSFDAAVFPNAATLRGNQQLGRLRITNKLGNTDGDPQYEQLYAYGARSFAIWNSAGAMVYESGSDLETRLATLLPTDFNSSHDASQSFDSRSDDKGPEPEGVTLAEICGHIYAFIALERVGGVMVYDVTNPFAPTYVTYANSRNFGYVFGTNPTPADLAAVRELGPEQSVYIPASQSPNNHNLLLLSNEVSGSVSVYQINGDCTPTGPAEISVSEGSYCVSLCPCEELVISIRSELNPPIINSISFTPGCLNCGGECEAGSGTPEWRLIQLPSGEWALSITLPANGVRGCFCLSLDATLPVEFGTFTAISGNNQVTLNWNTLTETDNERFEISRNGNLIAQVASLGNSTSGHSYRYTDNTVINGTTYSYSLVSVDVNGTRHELATQNATPNGSASVINEYNLSAAYPNPFNPSTSFSYSVKEAGLVNLIVYDINGRMVSELVNTNQSAGTYQVTFDGKNLSSGIYYYRLSVNNFTATNKMVLMK